MKEKLNRLLKKEKITIDIERVLNKFAKDQGWTIREYRIKRILSRPFSIVVNIKIIHPREQSVFVKIYKPSSSQKVQYVLRREYEITQYWFKQFQSQKYFHTIEPLWVDYDNLILITKESTGINLRSFLEERIRFLPSVQNIKKAETYLELVGNWLAYFQKHPIGSDIPYLDTSIQMDLDYFLEYINLRMDRMVSNSKISFDKNMQQAINTAITQLWNAVDSEKNNYCISHSDLSLSNILINDKHVTVLDFYKSEINSPFKDLSRLYHQLFLFSFKLDYQTRIIRKLQTALLRGWGDESVDAHPLFRIFFLMHQINHLGKIARYWERNFVENIYNRWVVRQSLKHLKEFIAHESQTKN